ncbi:hypothetical protein ACOSQ4_017386 [Xanthoceras sorbifolium]
MQGTGQSSSLNLRIPFWTNSNGAKATLNNQNLPLPSPGNFLSVTKQWSAGDKLTLKLPIALRTEAINDNRPKYASVQAILYGPYLLAGIMEHLVIYKTAETFSACMHRVFEPKR